MAKGINKAMLLGHVGKDPEIRSTKGGTLVATFSLATADRHKDAQGDWSDRTEWHHLVAFNGTAEVVRDFVKKGTPLFIEGRIQTRSWDDKATGGKQYRTEVLINDLTLLGGKPNQERGASSYKNGARSTRSSASGGYGRSAISAVEEYTDQGISDDDIPF